jgi:hypothetical protein
MTIRYGINKHKVCIEGRLVHLLKPEALHFVVNVHTQKLALNLEKYLFV